MSAVKPASPAPTRVVVLLSGSGSNLQALLDAQTTGTLGAARVAAVLSDRGDAYGLQRALSHGIAAASVPLDRPRNAAARSAWEAQFTAVVAAFAPDILLLSGFMRVLSPAFLERFPGRIINQHPALLPDDDGPIYTTSDGSLIPALRGAHVVADALRQGLTITGCTVHYVTPVVDTGPVLARAEVPILPDDDETTLHERIKIEERRLIVEVVRRLAE
jgi:phosphoribosylglycinamide formyltransferase 1